MTQATISFPRRPAVRAPYRPRPRRTSPSIAAQDATNPETDFPYLDKETIYIRLDHSMPPIPRRPGAQGAEHGHRPRGLRHPAARRHAAGHHAVPPPTLGWNKDAGLEIRSRGAKKLLEEAKADGVSVDTKLTLVARTTFQTLPR